MSIVGKYKAAKIFSVNAEGKLGMMPVDEAVAIMKSKAESPREAREADFMANTITEFTEDGKVIEWIPVPEGVGPEEIEAAIKDGEFECEKDGYLGTTRTEWKEENGSYFVDSHQTREVMGEQLSSWDEFKANEEGLYEYGSGFTMLKKI